MMWIVIYVLSVVTIFVWLLSWPFYWKIRKVKHIFPLPIFGNCLPIIRLGNEGFVKYLYDKFPGEKCLGFHFFTRPALFIKDPELIYQIMVKDFDHFTSNGVHINYNVEPLKNNIIFANGEHWKSVKETLSPHFTPAKTKAMLNSVNNILAKMTRTFDDNIKNNQPIEMTNIFMKVGVEMINQTLLTLDSDTLKTESSLFLEFIKYISRPHFNIKVVLGTVAPKIFDLFKIRLTDTDLMQFVNDVVVKVVDYRKNEKERRQDFIQGMIDRLDDNYHSEKGHISNQTKKLRYDLNDITSHILSFNGAGVESVALITSFCLYELALHPDIQEKCRCEVLSVVKECGNEYITVDVAKSLPYLNAAVKETLRIHPILSIFGRECTKDYQVNGSHLTIEKGTYVVLAPTPVHKDEKYFSQPNTFQPERFFGKTQVEVKPGTYFPFGQGPRSCLGKYYAQVEMNLILSRLLQTYEFTVCSKTTIPMEYAKFTFLKTPRHGIWLNVKRIQRRSEANSQSL